MTAAKRRIVIPKSKTLFSVYLFGKNQQNKIVSLLLLKEDSSKEWNVINGWPKPGELTLCAAANEAKKQTGLELSFIKLVKVNTCVTYSPVDCIKLCCFAGIIRHNATVKPGKKFSKYTFMPLRGKPKTEDEINPSEYSELSVHQAWKAVSEDSTWHPKIDW